MLLDKYREEGLVLSPDRPYILILKCGHCGTSFERNIYQRKKSFGKFGTDLCQSCSIAENNRNEEKRKKNGETIRSKMRGMSEEERKEKYGNDSWKRNDGFLEKQKDRNGHGDAISRTISRLSESERKRKYGRSGEENHMYGKPAPAGSGNGYSGWFKGIFFRSKLELSFLIHHSDHDIISAESLFSIPYVNSMEVNRSYRPDFLFDKTKVVEVKPRKMMFEGENTRKYDAARRYFDNSIYEYVIYTEDDFHVLSFDELLELVDEGVVTLVKYSEERLRRKYESKESRNNRAPV